MKGETITIKSLLLQDKDRAVWEEETKIASDLNRAHLVRTYNVFRYVSNATMHVVIEFTAGGELQKRADIPDVLYTTLSGKLPFPGAECEEYCNNSVNQPLEFPSESWWSLPTDACDNIEGLMDKNVDTLITTS